MGQYEQVLQEEHYRGYVGMDKCPERNTPGCCVLQNLCWTPLGRPRFVQGLLSTISQGTVETPHYVDFWFLSVESLQPGLTCSR